MIGDWTLAVAAQAIEAEVPSQVQPDLHIVRICTDTRQVKPGDLFVCLRGEHFDAHDFLKQAREKGAVAAVTERLVDDPLPQLCVNDSLIALGRLAALNRNRFAGRVVAVTGSSGKTTVKELLASMLSTQGATLYTQGNLNNHIGAPLTLLQLEASHQFAVIELGASAEGEIDYTVHLTQPHVSVLNNACAAHIEGFGSLQGVVRAKSEIFNALSDEGVGIVNLDDPHADFWREKLDNMRRAYLTFSAHNPDADVWVSQAHADAAGAWGFRLNYQQEQVAVQLRLLGQHNVSNAVAATAAWLALGLPLREVKAGLEACEAVKGRMKPIALPSGWLIDDSYNANPQAMQVAIDYLAARPGQRLLVLGDMAELGAEAEALHHQLGHYAAQAELDGLYATGPLMRHAVESARQSGLAAWHFEQQSDLIEALKQRLSEPVTLLVKGSRSALMDRVVSALQQGDAQ
ncbi:MAG: UDP-N-acetylmuramoyl-tripeptide--D-alanyl-D-alanine ligase [Nitrincola lacisaponensis]|uniref:UDP-N-acetylmuramoyl-tripeptide--D-alanyl-D- alanine ligase n=1 Tax=Nitrincola lacisaponensis TaxID=267850 RepID=UPI00391B84F9